MIAEFAQWIGFACIIYGYAVFGRARTLGASLSLLGAFALIVWCALQAVVPVGVLALQAAFVVINLRYICQGIHDRKRKSPALTPGL